MKELSELKLETTRLSRQIGIIKKWFAAGRIGLLLASTGFGKTTTGIITIRRLMKIDPFYKNTLVVVPTVYLKEQWEEKVKEHELINVRVIVINSLLIECESTKIDATLLILDEIHKYVADEFGKVYDCVNYNNVLGLTATIDFADERFNIIKDKCPVFDEVTIEECLKNGWVNDFTIYTIPTTLTLKERLTYNNYNDKAMYYQSLFGYDYAMMMKCLNKDIATAYARSINSEPDKIHLAAINGNKFVRLRKELLYNAENKYEIVKQINERFGNTKTLYFSQTSKSADRITELIPSCKSYHSNLNTIIIDKENGEQVGQIITNKKSKTKLYYINGVPQSKLNSKIYKRVSKDKQLETIMKDYIDNKFTNLSTAIMLDVGADIPDIETTVIHSATSKALQDIQRRGRGIRKFEDKIARNIQIYVEGTQDEKWLKSRLKLIPQKYIVSVRSVLDIV